MSGSLVLKPRMSEKAYGVSEERNTYVFDVPAGANKHMVAEAVADQYKVGVRRVRIAKTAPKSRRTIRRRGRNIYRGQSSGVCKAYVTLREDETLPIFASVKEEEKKETAKAKKEAKSESPAEPIAKDTPSPGDKGPKHVSQPEKRGRRFGLYTRGDN